MPRYFFHVKDGNGIHRDSEGLKLPDIEAARNHALKDARDLMCQNADGIQDLADWEIQVCDQTGQQLLVVRFPEAVHGGLTPKRS